MNKNLLDISIIIIGYNSKNSLIELLYSLDQIKEKKHVLEIIYIDDGSKDESLNLFKSHKTNFNKKFFRFKNNRGRVFARKKGSEIASGQWFWFLNSNVVVKNNIIDEYKKAIDIKLAKVYAGHVFYESNDVAFSKYLNHHKRGINCCNNGDFIPYEYLLFSNCLIAKIIFQKIDFNFNLKGYGGEELDFAYKVNRQYPNNIIAAKNASVVRKNIPCLKNYLLKFYEFGNKNFVFLDPFLQKKIIRHNLFLYKKIPFFVFRFLNFCFMFLIKIPAFRKNFYFVRGLFLLNIIRGRYSK